MSGNGINGALSGVSPPTYMAISAFTAVAWYNAIELNLQVFLTFKRHRGLYFWSLLVSCYGCVLHSLGFVMKFFQLTTNNYISCVVITIGWYAMVTGQAVVLYSRLHLVVREQRTLRLILAMIIVDAICFHIPTTVLTFGSNSPHPGKYAQPFSTMEKIQMTVFSLQEFVISGVYVYATIKLLRPVYHGRTRKVMMQLIWINLIIVSMDVVLLAMEYTNFYYIEATLKSMVYSIKLKLEFAVLNQLMQLANSGVSDATLAIANHREVPDDPRAGSVAKPRKGSLVKDPYDAYTGNRANATARFPCPKWIPSLDRNCIVKTERVEVSSEDKQGAGIDLSKADPGGLLNKDYGGLDTNYTMAQDHATGRNSPRSPEASIPPDFVSSRPPQPKDYQTLHSANNTTNKNNNSTATDRQSGGFVDHNSRLHLGRPATNSRGSLIQSRRPSVQDYNRSQSELAAPPRENILRSTRPSVSEFRRAGSPTSSEIQLDPMGEGQKKY
ncbi:MAG: hypothetical protein M1835_001490 [Candelina submexicana]|nr:MAG: hypothetical protein M1835_001490 [Candelina submexicana]